MIHPVAVLGGGIAGAAAALRLAQGGQRPLWIAARRPEAFKPGEHLSAAAIPLLKALGSDAMLRSEVHRYAHSTYSAWGSDTLIERNAIVQLEGPPSVLDRGAFEDALTDQAIAAGATRLDQDVTRIEAADGHWHLDLSGEAVKAAFLFDATGRKAIVASKAAPRFQADKLCCLYALYQTGTEPRPVTLIEAAEDGWWYLSALPGKKVVVNFYTDADLPGFDAALFDNGARHLRAIGSYLGDYDCQLATRPKRITCNSAWIAPCIGAGWTAIGDASAAFDPLSSHGMTTALWSAIQAADAFLARDAVAMRSYADEVAKGIQDYLIKRRHVYAREQRWPDSPFWGRRISDQLAEA